MARAPRGLDPNVEHLLAINAVRIALALHLPDARGALHQWQSDWELRVPKRSRRVPDALFEVVWGDQDRAVYALELDRHTKTPQRFLAAVPQEGRRLCVATFPHQSAGRPLWLLPLGGRQ